MISPAKRAELLALRSKHGLDSPATDARSAPAKPADTRPRFQGGPFDGKLIDPHDRFVEGVDPETVLTRVALGDPDFVEFYEARKTRFERWSAEHAEREKVALHAKPEEDSRAALTALGFEVPEGVTASDFFAAHAVEIKSMERAAQLRTQATELSAQADRTAAEVKDAIAAKEKAAAAAK